MRDGTTQKLCRYTDSPERNGRAFDLYWCSEQRNHVQNKGGKRDFAFCSWNSAAESRAGQAATAFAEMRISSRDAYSRHVPVVNTL